MKVVRGGGLALPGKIGEAEPRRRQKLPSLHQKKNKKKKVSAA